MLIQSMRMTLRDWRAGELRFLLIALVVAVAALSSVGFFVDRLRAGLNRDAHQLLGADLVVNADHPLDIPWYAQAKKMGLRTVDTAEFGSMAIAGDGNDARTQLASVKAVSEGYPLRGHLRLRRGNHDEAVSAIPASGTAWVDANLLSALDLTPGGALKLGDKIFRVAGIIATEPDRGTSFMNFMPRVMIAMADLPDTHLIQDGSRVAYRLLIAGDASSVNALQQWAKQTMKAENLKGIRLESLESGRPEMRATLDRAERFLCLVGLLSAILAAIAVAMAARRFMLRHIDSYAMLRCLGLTQRQATTLFLLEFLMLGAAASVLGILLGFGAHFVLLQWLGSLVASDLPAAGIAPALQGGATGLLLLVGFALPPLLQLRNVPHNRVMRREQLPPKPAAILVYGAGLAAFIALLFWQAGDVKLGAITAGGFGAGVLLFALFGWAALLFARWLNVLPAGSGWRFALVSLQRRRSATIVQMVALALGLMALLLLTVIRADLVAAWKRSVPPDAPNRFVINIQPDQRQAIEQRLAKGDLGEPELYPMIRGRLVRINGKPVVAGMFQEDRARHLVNREFNLSTMQALPEGNRIEAGHWFDDRQPEASIESGLAQTLGLKLGDELVFNVAGQEVRASVTSLRKLDWSSMRVNFFVIINPSSVRGLPATWITAFHLPDERSGFINALVRDFPNLTVIDVSALIREMEGIVEQVTAAVEFLFIFALISGLLVLYAALAGSQEERVREAALLRALGATRAQLSRAQACELALVGGIAGLLSASGASAVGWALATHVFGFEWRFLPDAWAAGLVAGIICAFAGGWLGLRGVLLHPPLYTLREA